MGKAVWSCCNFLHFTATDPISAKLNFSYKPTSEKTQSRVCLFGIKVDLYHLVDVVKIVRNNGGCVHVLLHFNFTFKV